MKDFLLRRQQAGIDKTEQKEAELAGREGAVAAPPTAPERTEIIAANFLEDQSPGFYFTYFTRIFPHAMKSIRGITRGFRSLKNNPVRPKTRAPAHFAEELIQFARFSGADIVGFCSADPRFIFRNRGILYPNVIVLAREMDKEKVTASPSPESFEMIMKTYAHLGETGNSLADFLRSNGYGAQASHSLGGIALYPVLAQMAGIGFVGTHGLLITPEFGSRQRLSAVFTSIENLPDPPEQNPHSWMMDYCYTCDICIRVCPGGAIHRVPVQNDNGTMTHIENEKCFPVFYRKYGCSWCIRECPFSTVAYEDLKRDFESTSDAFLKELKQKRQEDIIPGCVGTGRGM